MNVDSIPACHWDALSNQALPIVQRLRKSHVAANAWQPLGDRRSVRDDVLRPQLQILKRTVSNHFYSELYEKMTAGLGYEMNLPGEPDAAWAKLVAVWEGMKERRTEEESTVVAEPDPNAVWVPDQARAQCRRCKTDFGVFTRKHHCRVCGEIFCDRCSNKRLDVKNSWNDRGQRVPGVQTDQRVCDGCYGSWDQIKKNAEQGSRGVEKELGITVGSQKGKVEGPGRTQGARLWEYYTNMPAVSRFQFVVKEGGGIVLLSRLDRAFKSYFLTNQNARLAFQGWKIFGEAAAQGRSDSSVIYLLRPFEHPDVQGFWRHVCSDRTMSELKKSINTSFTAPGLFDMGNGAWGLDLPVPSDEIKVLKKNSDGSAGGLIGTVLGAGYAQAAEQLHAQPDLPVDTQALTIMARYEVRILVNRLYPSRRNPLPQLPRHLMKRVGRDVVPAGRLGSGRVNNRMGGRF